MKKVSIKYNPYLVTTEVTVDGQLPKSNSQLNVDKLRLQDWVDRLPDILRNEYRDNNFEISFTGTQTDYEDVTAAFKPFAKAINVSFHFDKKADIADVEKEVKAIFKEIQEGPIAELRDKKIVQAFEKAENALFDINVVATMSSGKSTLINALLGRQLMPAANEATTATIVRIIDTGTNQKDFSGVAFDKSGNIVAKIEKVTLSDMRKLNADPKVSMVELKGRIPFVSSVGMKLVLVDTPGPNNSRDERHKEMTYRMLADSDKSMVLYVMNGQQLGINDEKIFLDYICKNMESGGKQARERFIFVVNKMDAFKPKDEGLDCINNALNNVKDSLEERKIFNPNIFPVSAAAALDKRIDDDDADVWPVFKKKTAKYPVLHFENYYQYSHLPRISQSIIEKMKENASDDDIVEIHTGIVSVEQAISLYVNKYARTMKVRDLVEAFNEKLNEVAAVAHLEEAIRADKNAKAELEKQIDEIRKNIKTAKDARSFSKTIDNIDLTTQSGKAIDECIRGINANINDILEINEEKVPKEKAYALCENLERTWQALFIQFKIDVEKIFTQTYKNAVNEIMKEYEKYLSALNLQVNSLSVNVNPLSLVSASLSDLSQIMKENTETEDESYTVREAYQKRVEGGFFRKAANILSLGRIKDYTYETAYRDKRIAKYVDYVNMRDVANEYFTPLRKDLEENGKKLHDYLNEETERLKEALRRELEKIDELLEQKLNDLDATKDAQKLKSEEIRRKEQNLRWLEKIQERINNLVKF